MSIAVYDLATSRILREFPGGDGFPRWLPDARHVCYFTRGGEGLMVLDTLTAVAKRIDVRLPLPAVDQGFAVAPDGRAIYYAGGRTEADIWIVERK